MNSNEQLSEDVRRHIRIFQPIVYGFSAGALMLALYFVILTTVSGWSFAQSQSTTYWYYIVSLALGFGIQIGLYKYLKQLVHSGQGTGKVVGVSGATSTVAMISCCTHYLVNLLPILGVIGVVTIIAQYQIELFWVGIIFNVGGIIYILIHIIKISRT